MAGSAENIELQAVGEVAAGQYASETEMGETSELSHRRQVYTLVSILGFT